MLNAMSEQRRHLRQRRPCCISFHVRNEVCYSCATRARTVYTLTVHTKICSCCVEGSSTVCVLLDIDVCSQRLALCIVFSAAGTYRGVVTSAY
jgi:hypothetical protein